MRWEDLTADDFAQAVKDTKGVCLFSLGVLERHGVHLPLGTDVFMGQHVAELSAQREPAIVFPQWYFGQIYEARCFAGTITLPPPLLIEVILSVFDEIARNGLTKIVMLIAHGGNNHLAPFLCQCQLERPRAYQLYSLNWYKAINPERRKQYYGVMQTDGGGHAGESETSHILAIRPDLVKLDRLQGRHTEPLGRLNAIAPADNGFGWYADFPDHYAGDARTASAEKGVLHNNIIADSIAAVVKAIKDDTVAPALAQEFFQREAALRT